MPTVNGFDRFRYPIRPELPAFLRGEDSGGPTMRKLCSWLDSLVTELESWPGLCVLQGFPEGIWTDHRAVLRFSELLGTPIPQDRHGTVVREVRDRGSTIGQGESTRYADSRFGGHFHTDGAEAGFPVPDMFALFCVRQAMRGGSLHLAHLRDVVRELAGQEAVVDVLGRPFHFHRRGDGTGDAEHTVAKPILFDHRGRPAVTYLRRYVELGHRQRGAPELTAGQHAALDAFDAAVDRTRKIEGRMRPDEVLIVNNLRTLHARTEFVDHPDPARSRLLLRTWISRDERRR
ncbi:Taurine catabolism dioxygenase TauD, TfdA family [Thermomonospora echinospora]|uniref:Taurine catabolism dioxygenase TauD, TfdA family n=1 Tax=Thermomonospora echinospora TaxID=1992 RepID=A0A1H6DWD4_9ACTN|nr:TauD/TfdA family dioxygenase [Thermomonospora echinospora]SEG89394.1 Taurine catabolism dioxygenase TauD, TfdA family [Thermomonospora echinospora]